MKQNDRSDLTAIRDGLASAEGVSELLERHRDRIKRLVSVRLDRRVKARVDDSDIVQEVMLEASRRIQEYSQQDDPMPLPLWLRYIAIDRINMCHRRHLGAECRDANREHLADESHLRSASRTIAMQLIANIDSPSRRAIKTELFQRVESALQDLDSTDREILMLRHFEQLDNQETAAVLGMKPSTASSRYLRALVKLRSQLKQFPEFRDPSTNGLNE